MLYCHVDEILAYRSVLSKAIYSGKCRYYFAINISLSEEVGEVLSFNGCNSPTVFDLRCRDKLCFHCSVVRYQFVA